MGIHVALPGLTFVLAMALAFAAPTQSASTPGDGSQAAGGPVQMRVYIEYRPIFPATGEVPGDLHVYLDGDLLAWVPRGGQFAPSSPARFERQVATGPHVVQVSHEKHELRAGGTWLHEARMATAELFFHLAPGDAELELRVIETRSRDPTPISVAARQDGKVIASLEDAGTRLADWPMLCEEIEANLDPRKRVPRKIRAKLERCVRWEALWRSLGEDLPTRDQVRAILERYDFRPRTYKRFE